MLVRFDVRVTLKLPDVRIGVGRGEEPSLLVGDYVVFCGVDDEERYTLIRELRGLLLRYHIPGVEIWEEPPCEQDRRTKGPPEAHELRNLALQKDREIRVCGLLDDCGDTRPRGRAQGCRSSHRPAERTAHVANFPVAEGAARTV